MNLLDIPSYLIGRRGAILRIASSRWALVVGFLLVLSGSLARNYDGAYLLKEWDVLLHGVTVSIANSFVLFLLMHLGLRKRNDDASEPTSVSSRQFFSSYLCFLGLFWISAPMAWLYALPYERWMTPVDAVQANMNTLALVSVWRVALMTRVLSVLFQTKWLPTLFIVLLFSDVAILIGAVASPTPLVDFMGGMQHTPGDAALVNANLLTKFFGAITLPVWFACGVISLAHLKRRWCVQESTWGPPPRLTIAVAVLLIAAWAVPLSHTQTEQRNRWTANRLLRSDQIAEALTFMSSKTRQDFPPIWDPAPRLGYDERTPMIESVAAIIMQSPPADWVVREYVDKSRRYLFTYHHGGWRNLDSIVETSQPHIAAGDAGLLARLRLHERYDDTLTEEDRAYLAKGIRTLEARLAPDAPVDPATVPDAVEPE